MAKAKGAADTTFKRLPFNYCALSLQPFKHPVCTTAGTIFDIENIVPWLEKHGTNPVDGQPLKNSDLIRLNFAKNEDGEYVDPITYKIFTDNTHMVALKSSGNVFAWDTVERLNIKPKNWRDLVTDEEFTRKDIITLQDPTNIESRNFNAFKHLKDGTNTPPKLQEVKSDDIANQKVLKAREAVARARAVRAQTSDPNKPTAKTLTTLKNGTQSNVNARTSSPKPFYHTALHTTGKTAASFTSTGLTPHTSIDIATLTDEEYMLNPKLVKNVGFARITTNHGDVDIELYPEYAPRAVWNFVRLAQTGYYKNLIFHRNIKNFMIQGGDPTGTGRGGQSIWGANFKDELDGPLSFTDRGMLAMANKGKNTNSSQFFITYRAAKHLERKHTIFGKVVGGLDTLKRLEDVRTDEKDRPLEDIRLVDVSVLINPFEEFLKERDEKEMKEREDEEIRRAGGTEDDKMTWTGKRVRADGKVVDDGGGIGRYLVQDTSNGSEEQIVDILHGGETVEPPRKKAKSEGFGGFGSW